MRLIVGITGASGVIMGYRLLQELRSFDDIETHLVVTDSALRTFSLESEIGRAELRGVADVFYENNDLAASISSGSFPTAGMVVLPCSMKTLSGIVNGFSTNLLIRAADVCIKEGRKLVLVPRETPLSKVHLKNLLAAADCGCSILPPMLTFYNRPQTTEDQIQHILGKILMQFGLAHSKFKPWESPSE